MRRHDRTIKVVKADLIAKIRENKAAHIKAYEEAVVAYKTEALRQLSELTNKATNGDLQLQLNLITPINNTENYDKIVEMFEWEVSEHVELDASEFNEYIQDETDFAIQAKYSNSYYTASVR